MRIPLEERLWPKIRKGDTPDDCWMWTAGINGTGYGQISSYVDGRPAALLAHRVVYEIQVGPIPKGLELDHICRVRRCCNPRHLRPVTRQQNSQNVTATRASSTGVRGVYWHKKNKKYIVQVGYGYKHVYGGSFETLEEAERAAIALRNKMHTHNDTDLASR